MGIPNVHIVLVAGGQPETQVQYSLVLQNFFSLYHAKAHICLYSAAANLPEDFDALVYMGDLSSEYLPATALPALQQRGIPVVAFGVTVQKAQQSYAAGLFPLLSLCTAQTTAFSHLVGHFVQLVGNPLESANHLQLCNGSATYLEGATAQFDAQFVAISRIVELIREYYDIKKLKPTITANNLQQLFDRSEQELNSRHYHIAAFLQRLLITAVEGNLVRFRLAQTENMLGHTEVAQKHFRDIFRKDHHFAAKFLAPEHPHHNFVYYEKKYPNQLQKSCPLCKQPGVLLSSVCSISATSYFDGFDPIRTWAYCPQCDHAFVHNAPANLNKLLEDDYTFLQAYNPTSNTSYCSNHFSPLLDKLASINPGKQLLDIGTGQGELALTALEYGYHYTGIEIVPAYANNVQQLINHRIHCMDFMDFNTTERYDIIVMGDVIEHVKNPKSLLLHAASFLKEDGLLWLSTPNLWGAYAITNKLDDAMPMEVWHMQYFSKNSLELLLHETGLEMLNYTISRRYLGSMELICKKTNA